MSRRIGDDMADDLTGDLVFDPLGSRIELFSGSATVASPARLAGPASPRGHS